MRKEFAGFAHDGPRFTVDCIKRDVSGIMQQNTFPHIVWQANFNHETFFFFRKNKKHCHWFNTVDSHNLVVGYEQKIMDRRLGNNPF